MTGARQAGAYRAQARRSGATRPYPDPFGLLPTLAWTVAGQAYEHYGYQDWIAKQVVPWTASGTVSVTIQATTPGSNGNADAGTTFYIATPIAGVGSQGSASGPITGGADQETQDAFRTRMLQIWAAPPQGGDATDYVEWALAVPGVTRAWSGPERHGRRHGHRAPHDGRVRGGARRFSARHERRRRRGDARHVGIGDQLAVADAIYPKRPATALVYACAPASQAVNYMY